ncbi:hypothetical protein ABT297_16710 [Dactylosporangium sp. NPDC000555]|uniref:hypothetical protein n=1 Tax=Dactylosporangium sp. NPDC000555 TaxID=3154260 RepID=UPI003328825B
MREQLRVVVGDSVQAVAVKVLARAHQTLIWERPGRSCGCARCCGSTSQPRSRRSRISTHRSC